MSKLFPHTKANSIDEYFALPRKEREKFGVYLLPESLPWNGFDDSDDKGWRAFEERIAKEYPIQYFIRNVWENIDIWFSQFKQKLDMWWIWAFNPQHSELRAAIPRNWIDLDSCVEKFLFACVVSYVEKENGLSNLVWMRELKAKQLKLKSRKISKEERAAIRAELDNHGGEKTFNDYYEANYYTNELIEKTYDWITKVRPKYQKVWELGEGFTDDDGEKFTWEKLDKYIDEMDDYYIKKIVEYRKYLWT